MQQQSLNFDKEFIFIGIEKILKEDDIFFESIIENAFKKDISIDSWESLYYRVLYELMEIVGTNVLTKMHMGQKVRMAVNNIILEFKKEENNDRIKKSN